MLEQVNLRFSGHAVNYRTPYSISEGGKDLSRDESFPCAGLDDWVIVQRAAVSGSGIIAKEFIDIATLV
ncbi:hypothetical protein ABTY96_43495 [Streptomyces sp. NPDC096057]|uniref:hypothetical protein n=1 Tax=Streptomyces sp. NPDC096057 TaxID=3155543 RepID=UPI003321A552